MRLRLRSFTKSKFLLYFHKDLFCTSDSNYMRVLKQIILIFILLIVCSSPSLSYTKHKASAPVKGTMASPFGPRNDPFSGQWAFHYGIDIAAGNGTPIFALQEGRVLFSGKEGGYGNCIVIDHNYPEMPEVPRVQTKYGHNSQNIVQKGDYVHRGQVIAYVGSTGRSTGPHLHFEVIYNGTNINPIDYLYKLPAYLDYVAATREKQGYTSYLPKD